VNRVFIEVGRKMNSKCAYSTFRNYFGRVTYFEGYVAFLFKIHLLLLFYIKIENVCRLFLVALYTYFIMFHSKLKERTFPERKHSIR
jgi:hypothetical protein